MKSIVFLCIALLSFSFSGSAQGNQSPNAPVFKFVEETHDFGTIKEGPQAVYEFVFTNTGREPLIIQSCSASCGCTTPDWSKDPILPGQKGKITVFYCGVPNLANVLEDKCKQYRLAFRKETF